MHIKFVKYAPLHLALLFTLLGAALSGVDAAPTIRPFGLVLRPNLFDKIVRIINENFQGFTVTTCWQGFYFSGVLSAKWNTPDWSVSPRQELILENGIQDMVFQGQAFRGCPTKENPEKTIIDGDPFIISAKQVQAQVIIDWLSQRIKLTPHDSQKIARSLELKLPRYPTLQENINDDGSKEFFVNFMADTLASQMSSALKNQFSQFTFLEPVSKILSDTDLYSGLIIQSGAATIEVEAPDNVNKGLSFAFLPIRQEGIFVERTHAEFYFGAGFMNAPDLEILSGMSAAANPTLVYEKARAALSRLSSLESSKSIVRPSLAPNDSDISLVIPTLLVNDALFSIYREGLLRFKTVIDIGGRTAHLFSGLPVDLSASVRIAPESAPQISFQAERLQLNIQDTALEIGAYLEDRLIPASKIELKASVDAELFYDTKTRRIGIRMNPSTFNIELAQKKPRLRESEMQFIQEVADSIWKVFLEKNKSLYLFPSILDLGAFFGKQAKDKSAPFEIVGVKTQGPSIIVDLSLKSSEFKL